MYYTVTTLSARPLSERERKSALCMHSLHRLLCSSKKVCYFVHCVCTPYIPSPSISRSPWNFKPADARFLWKPRLSISAANTLFVR